MSAGRVGHRSVVTVSVDPIACEAYGYCAELLGEMVTLDEWGYPIADGSPVPSHLVALARKAARDCPRRALLLSEKPRLLSEKPRLLSEKLGHRVEG